MADSADKPKRKRNRVGKETLLRAAAMRAQTLPPIEAVYKMAGHVKPRPVSIKDAAKLLEVLDDATRASLVYMEGVISNRAHPEHDAHAAEFALKVLDVCAPRRRIVQGDAENPFALRLLPEIFGRPMPRDEKGRALLSDDTTEYDDEILSKVRRVEEEVSAD